MSYLYLDESGNLGHQFQSSGVSRHFVITILEVPDEAAKKAIEKAVERTMKNKVRGKSRLQRNLITELKGAKTSFAIKNYFCSICSIKSKRACHPRFLWISFMTTRRRISPYKPLISLRGESIENTKPGIRSGTKYFAARLFTSKYTPNKKESDPYTALPQGYGQPMEGNTLRTV